MTDINEDRDVSIDEMVAYLMRDGDLDCPGSRYGRKTSECAYWAIALHLIYVDMNGPNGASLSDSLDGYMSRVVNDSDGVLTLVADYSHVIADHDDWHIAGLVDDAEDLLIEDIDRYLGTLTASQLLQLRVTVSASY